MSDGKKDKKIIESELEQVSGGTKIKGRDPNNIKLGGLKARSIRETGRTVIAMCSGRNDKGRRP